MNQSPTSRFLLLILFVLCCIPAACTPNVYDKVSDEIEISYQENGFSPLLWRVPSGETITLLVENTSDQEWHWILMARPVTLPFDEDDWQNTLAEFTIPPHSEETLNFTAPQAAGEYDVVCNTDLTEDNPGPVGTMVVFRLRELTTTPY
jgi:plastocyanin